MRDIVARLRRDAGQLTIAELIQEREAAACEIERLRGRQERLRAPVPSARTAPTPPPPAPRVAAERPQPFNWGLWCASPTCASSWAYPDRRSTPGSGKGRSLCPLSCRTIASGGDGKTWKRG